MKLFKNHFYIGARRLFFNEQGDCVRGAGVELARLYVGTEAMAVLPPFCIKSNRTPRKLMAANRALRMMGARTYDKDGKERKTAGWQFFSIYVKYHHLEVGCQEVSWTVVRKILAMRKRAMGKATRVLIEKESS